MKSYHEKRFQSFCTTAIQRQREVVGQQTSDEASYFYSAQFLFFRIEFVKSQPLVLSIVKTKIFESIPFSSSSSEVSVMPLSISEVNGFRNVLQISPLVYSGKRSYNESEA